jgi:hypothetical protein
MQRPRTPGAGVTGAVRISLGGVSTSVHRRPAPTVQRLQQSRRLQQAFRRLHQCGPQPEVFFVAALIDALGAAPAAIDFRDKHTREWFSQAVIAARALRDDDGKVRYLSLIDFADAAAKRRWQAAIIDAVAAEGRP